MECQRSVQLGDIVIQCLLTSIGFFHDKSIKKTMMLSRIYLLLTFVDCLIVVSTYSIVDLKAAFDRTRNHGPTVHADHHGVTEDSLKVLSSRRIFFGNVATTSAVLLTGTVAEARDELFRPNPLTNPVLEQVSCDVPTETSRFFIFHIVSSFLMVVICSFEYGSKRKQTT